MINLLLERSEFPDRTEGDLYVNGEWFCKTLEDPVRESKIPGETAIPYGIYDVVVTKSPKFGRYLPLLKDVPGFDGIRIHRGNYTKDTSGCILPGEYIKKGVLYNSTPYEEKLTEMLLKEDVAFIEIKRKWRTPLTAKI